MTEEHPIDIIRNKKMKSLRNSLGLKQKEFARSIGVSEGLISKVEKGVVPVTDKLITKVALEYQINPEWLQGKSDTFDNRDSIEETRRLRNFAQNLGGQSELQMIELRKHQSEVLENSLRDTSGLPETMVPEYLKLVNQCLEKLHMYLWYLKSMDMRRENVVLLADELEAEVLSSMDELKQIFCYSSSVEK